MGEGFHGSDFVDQCVAEVVILMYDLGDLSRYIQNKLLSRTGRKGEIVC